MPKQTMGLRLFTGLIAHLNRCALLSQMHQTVPISMKRV